MPGLYAVVLLVLWCVENLKLLFYLAGGHSNAEHIAFPNEIKDCPFNLGWRTLRHFLAQVAVTYITK